MKNILQYFRDKLNNKKKTVRIESTKWKDAQQYHSMGLSNTEQVQVLEIEMLKEKRWI